MDLAKLEYQNKRDAIRFEHDLRMKLIESEHRCMRHIMDKFSARHGLDTADSDQHSSTEDEHHDDHN